MAKTRYIPPAQGGPYIEVTASADPSFLDWPGEMADSFAAFRHRASRALAAAALFGRVGHHQMHTTKTAERTQRGQGLHQSLLDGTGAHDNAATEDTMLKVVDGGGAGKKRPLWKRGAALLHIVTPDSKK